jgi:translocation and assembly module TamB
MGLGRWCLWGVVGLLTLATLLLAGVLGALWRSGPAQAWVLQHVPGVRVVGPQGNVWGDFQAEVVEVGLPRGGLARLEGVRWSGLRLQEAPQAAWRLGVALNQLSVGRLNLRWVANPKASPGAPTDVGSPVAVRVAQWQVDEARTSWTGEAPLTGLQGAVAVQGLAADAQALGPDAQGTTVAAASWAPGQPRHVVRIDRLVWQGWTLGGRLLLATDHGLALAASVAANGQMHGAASRPGLVGPLPAGAAQPLALSARVQAQGHLSDLTLDVNLNEPAAAASQGGQTGRASGMAASAQARLQPFASWPVAALSLQAQSMDAARLWPGAPHTWLDGRVQLKPDGAAALLADWQLRNGAAGAWSEGHLPVRQTQGRMRWPQALQQGRIVAQPWLQGEVDALVEGPGASVAVGTLAGQPGGGQLRLLGGWGGARAMKLGWQNLWLPAWDRRAPPMQWAQGELNLEPDWLVAKASAQDSPPLSAPTGRWRLAAQGTVQGLQGTKGGAAARVDAGQAMSVEGRGLWRWQDGLGALDVQRLLLQAAPATAEVLDARLAWGQGRVQALRGQLNMKDFDPALWLPWPPQLQGRNQLSGQGRVQVDALAEGQLQLQLQPGWLAGLPVQGQMGWQASAHQARLTLDADLAGNSAKADATWPRRPGQPAWPHDGPSWSGTQARFQLQAPQLAALKSLLQVAGLRELQGQFAAQGQLAGMWPNVQTQGDWRAQGLRVQAERGPALSVGQAQGRWQWDGHHPGSTALVEAQIEQAEAQGWRVPKLVASLQGQLREHHLRVQGQAVVPGHGRWGGRNLSLDMAGQGAWRGNPQARDVGEDLSASVASWLGQLSQARLSLLPASTDPAPNAGKPPAAAAPDETLAELGAAELRWLRGPEGSAWTLQQPADLRLLGVAMRLDQFSWRQVAEHQAWRDDRLTVAARLLPIDVAGQLQRWQPDAGWGGKLQVSGLAQVKQDAAGHWHVLADLGRDSGDLTLREPTIEGSQAQALGIQETRLQLRAEGGEWRLSQRFVGALLGQFEGTQVVHARSATEWPAAQDLLSGKVSLVAPNLRPWGTWAPAGWRLTGVLRAEANLAGTLGAPTYEGLVTGQQLGVQNALMGVQLHDGELEAHLQGDQMVLTRFVARSAGAGSVSATAQARLLEPAQATLQVHADRFAVLQRVDRKLVISGDSVLQLGQEDVSLEGSLVVNQGLFDISRSEAPTVGDDVNVLGDAGAEGDDAGNAVSTRKTRLKVDIDLGQDLRIQGRGLEATLTGKLKAGMAARKPTLHGTVAVEKGRYAAYGQKLVVQRSSVVFTGSVDNPRLDILAMRPMAATATDSDVKVGVSITGTAQDPRIRLYSDPEMSETEKLSWLVLGRAPSGMGSADIGLLQSAAVALLSGEGKSRSDSLINALGLDQFTVRQNEAATTRETVVNVGKQVSRYWYVGYERNLNATSGSWQLVYRLAQRFMVRLQAGEANALDFIWSWRWD